MTKGSILSYNPVNNFMTLIFQRLCPQLFNLTCIGGRRPGDSEYSTKTLTHGPQQEANGGNTPMEQPAHELGNGAGAGRWVPEAIWGSVWLSGPAGDQAGLSVWIPNRKREK